MTGVQTCALPIWCEPTIVIWQGGASLLHYNTSDTRGNSPSYGTNYQKVGHDLASVDELAVLDGGKCILQLRGVRPFKSDKYDLTQHPNYKLTAGADKKNTFSIEAFLDHRLKLKPGDKYEAVSYTHLDVYKRQV